VSSKRSGARVIELVAPTTEGSKIGSSTPSFEVSLLILSVDVCLNSKVESVEFAAKPSLKSKVTSNCCIGIRHWAEELGGPKEVVFRKLSDKDGQEKASLQLSLRRRHWHHQCQILPRKPNQIAQCQ